MSVTKTQLSQINQFARNYHSILDQTHGREHLERTMKLASYLAEKEGADTTIVKLGAMLHQFHDAEEVKNYLETIELDPEVIEQVVHCVYCSHEGTIHEAKTIEAKVVYDADKLQVIGPFGIMREIVCDVGARKRTFREALKHTKEIEQKLYETLQTETAKRLARKPHGYLAKFWEMFEEWDKVDF